MSYLKFTIGIFIALAASRLIPHPPNFTSLLALSFYVPALLGRKYLPAVVLSFVVTDFFIGFHSTILFTWGSIVLIGLISQYFKDRTINRLTGAVTGAIIFFIVTNFGVWSLGSYGYSFEGIFACYTLALPFFAYSLISTFLFSCVIEIIYKFSPFKNFLKIINNQ